LLTVGVFFIAGLALLAGIDVKRGRRAARLAQRSTTQSRVTTVPQL
jgi:hypothetical protein